VNSYSYMYSLISTWFFSIAQVGVTLVYYMVGQTGGQPIESDDPLWEIFVALEGEGPETVVTGFCTVYRFYHYPDSTRLRISQVCQLTQLCVETRNLPGGLSLTPVSWALFGYGFLIPGSFEDTLEHCSICINSSSGTTRSLPHSIHCYHAMLLFL
jgi:hypothetical protein